MPNSPGHFRYLAALLYDALALLSLWFFATGLLVTLGIATIWWTRILLLVVSTAFFIYCWQRSGQTLGALAWRFKIINAQAQPPSARQASVRFCFACLSIALGGIGHWWRLIDREGRTLHDRIAGTWLASV